MTTELQPAALMRAEIIEQPRVLTNLLATSADILRAIAVKARKCTFALLAARGSSDNASTYGKYLLEGVAHLPTALAAPSLYTLYHTPPCLEGALVIGVSQSGQSADVVEVVQEARRQGAVTLAITNTADSPLAQTAEHVVLLYAGVEHALAATKTVTAQCAVYAMLAGLLANRSGLTEYLIDLPARVASVLNQEQAINVCARQWVSVERAVVAGRGFCYGAVQETALKLKETSFISAEPYSAADFMHGPLAMISPGYPILVFLNHDATLQSTMVFIDHLHHQGANVIVMVTPEAAQGSSWKGTMVQVDSPHPLLSTIPFMVAGQLFAMQLSVLRGYNPDISRGVTKVTVTR